MTQSTAFLLFGTDEKEPEARKLTAGELSAELIGGNLGAIRFAGTEVLRAVSFLVRDRDWGTCEATVSNLAVDEGPDRFTVSYDATFLAPDGARLVCKAGIEGTARSLSFAASFTPDADFETARAGFVTLHPVVGVAGGPVAVEHSDGSVEDAVFPDLIEPWQPFMDIVAITHEPLPGISAECRMAGDVFEMEDQRNWTDGSYKTYVRPLARPWPYRLEAGETVRQSVTVTLRAKSETPVTGRKDGQAVEITLDDAQGTLPAIGVGLRPECQGMEQANAHLLAELGARQLICHFDPDAGHGIDALTGFRSVAAASGLPVTLECFVPCKADLDVELSGIAEMVRASGLELASLAVSPSVDRQSTPPGSIWPECPPLEDVYAAARRAFPGVPLGAGMFSYFTELNRKRVPAEGLAYVTHCTNPIVHAADDQSVMQTFEALCYVTRSVRAIYGDRPYRIGPSTIAMRQNPYGSATKDNPSRKRVPMANVDPRHNALFGAAWTLAYAATVSDANLEVLSLSTLAGPFGLVAGEGEPVAAGGVRPLFHVLRWLAGLSGGQRLAALSSAPDRVLALGARHDGRTVVLLANITAETQAVRCDGIEGAELSILDEKGLAADGAPRAVEQSGATITLPPYAVARVVSR
ncbi:hypothetical protein [Sinorhizobium sp. BG8]|uniref:D-apionate lactonase n=1 Tax=Sinorhizobium sp. BG8 TaxID=2613773 RepID=UPI00193E061B|nr:hypothetical protein [Sinorhizobium sp. BG8]QRM54163.1 hypothetical protein F3Y30_06055 [Sinorhizobium sp. BG8]